MRDRETERNGEREREFTCMLSYVWFVVLYVTKIYLENINTYAQTFVHYR